jgi:hypothetical protein
MPNLRKISNYLSTDSLEPVDAWFASGITAPDTGFPVLVLINLTAIILSGPVWMT